MWETCGVILVVADFTVAPEHREQVLAAVAKMLETTRVEPGCARYDFCENAFAPNRFTFVEEWDSTDALRVHTRTAEMAAFQASTKDLLTDRATAIHEISSTRRL